MAKPPVLLGTQLQFVPAWNLSQGVITLSGDKIITYEKSLAANSTPTYEVGSLGTFSERQLNAATALYEFDFELLLDDDDKEQLEAIIAGQQLRYFQNNNRLEVEVTLNDERFATLEVLTRARQPSRGLIENRFDVNPTGFTAWQFSQFIIKFGDMNINRYNSDYWFVSCSAVESRLDLSDIT